MRTVADASVLIFLGKIRQLALLEPLFGGPFYLSDLVRQEVLTEGLPPEESEYLTGALASWSIVSARLPAKPGKSLGRSDWSVLELAKQVRAELVLADDKALRNVLVRQRFPVIGTLGILLRATREKRLAPDHVRDLMNELVTSHRLHISAETFQAFLKHLP